MHYTRLQPLARVADDIDKQDAITAVQSLFSQLSQIRSFHQILLATFESSVTATDYADTFIKYSDFFKMYTSYINSYDQHMDSVQLLRGVKRLNAVLDSGRDKLKGRDITSYLITPVQRIPRFELLLREVLRYTSDADETERLDFALEKVKAIALVINEDKRAAERKSKLLELAATLVDLDKCLQTPLLEAHRHFIMEGTLVDIIKKKPRHCVLFNDLFLWCSLPKLRVKGVVKLDKSVFMTHGQDPSETQEFSVSDVNTLFPELAAAAAAQAEAEAEAEAAAAMYNSNGSGVCDYEPDSPCSAAGDMWATAAAAAGLEAPANSTLPSNSFGDSGLTSSSSGFGNSSSSNDCLDLDMLPSPTVGLNANTNNASNNANGGNNTPIMMNGAFAPNATLNLSAIAAASAAAVASRNYSNSVSSNASQPQCPSTPEVKSQAPELKPLSSADVPTAAVGQGSLVFVRASPALRSRAALSAAPMSRPGSRAGSRAPSLGRGSRAPSPAPGVLSDASLHVEFRWTSADRVPRPLALRLAANCHEDKQEWVESVTEALRDVAWIRPGALPNLCSPSAFANGGAGAGAQCAGTGSGVNSPIAGPMAAGGTPGTKGRRASFGGAGPVMRSPKRFSLGGLGAYSTLTAPLGSVPCVPTSAGTPGASGSSNGFMPANTLVTTLSGSGNGANSSAVPLVRPAVSTPSRTGTPSAMRTYRPVMPHLAPGAAGGNAGFGAGTAPAATLAAALAAGPNGFGNVNIDGVSPTSANSASHGVFGGSGAGAMTPRVVAPRVAATPQHQQGRAGSQSSGTAPAAAMAAAAAAGLAPGSAAHASLFGQPAMHPATPGPSAGAGSSANSNARTVARRALLATSVTNSNAIGVAVGGATAGANAHAVGTPRAATAYVGSAAAANNKAPVFGQPAALPGQKKQFAVSSAVSASGLRPLSPPGSGPGSPVRQSVSPNKRAATAAPAGASPTGFRPRLASASPTNGLSGRVAELSIGGGGGDGDGDSPAKQQRRRRSGGLKSPNAAAAAGGKQLRSPGGWNVRSPLANSNGSNQEPPRSRARGRGFTFGHDSPPPASAAGADAAGGSPRSPIQNSARVHNLRSPRAGGNGNAGAVKSPVGSPGDLMGKENRKSRRRSGCNQQ